MTIAEWRSELAAALAEIESAAQMPPSAAKSDRALVACLVLAEGLLALEEHVETAEREELLQELHLYPALVQKYKRLYRMYVAAGMKSK